MRPRMSLGKAATPTVFHANVIELYPYGVSSQGRLREPDAAWIPSHHAWLARPGDDGAAGCR
jgi:hypothetical protein